MLRQHLRDARAMGRPWPSSSSANGRRGIGETPRIQSIRSRAQSPDTEAVVDAVRDRALDPVGVSGARYDVAEHLGATLVYAPRSPEVDVLREVRAGFELRLEVTCPHTA